MGKQAKPKSLKKHTDLVKSLKANMPTGQKSASTPRKGAPAGGPKQRGPREKRPPPAKMAGKRKADDMDEDDDADNDDQEKETPVKGETKKPKAAASGQKSKRRKLNENEFLILEGSFWPILEAELKKHCPTLQELVHGTKKNYAFVKFGSEQEANEAIALKNLQVGANKCIPIKALRADNEGLGRKMMAFVYFNTKGFSKTLLEGMKDQGVDWVMFAGDELRLGMRSAATATELRSQGNITFLGVKVDFTPRDRTQA